MADTRGTHCPACARDIGAWPVFSAGLPTRIWCPHCRARLRYEDAGGILLGLFAALALTAGAAWWASGELAPLAWKVRVTWFSGLLLGAWIPVELVTVWLLRTKKTLARVGA